VTNMKQSGSVAACLALTLVFLGADHAVRADDYPSRPIKLILPQPAGGAVDLIARAVGDRLAEQMRQPVIVENMPGANGSLAAGAVARAVPDGDTLMLAVDSNLVINPSLYHNLTYDSFRDFVPISVIAKLHMVLVANPNVEANNVRELRRTSWIVSRQSTCSLSF
jgi:tripartite-type tricarboxylate transporter receptor subunit TctC